MLPKQHRLPLRTEFKRIKKEGKLFQGRLFSLLVASGKPRQKAGRFAFIVSKKIHKNAVERNKIRRLLIESVRFLLPKIKSNTNTVFLAKKSLIDKDFFQIKEETGIMFKKVGLIEK